jgi:hypothetical protein
VMSVNRAGIFIVFPSPFAAKSAKD